MSRNNNLEYAKSKLPYFQLYFLIILHNMRYGSE